jgi:hypothetical protein
MVHTISAFVISIYYIIMYVIQNSLMTLCFNHEFLITVSIRFAITFTIKI